MVSTVVGVRRRRIAGARLLAAAALAAAAIAIVTIVIPGRDGRPTLHAEPATFAAVFASANPGDTVLLAAGDYGVWTGGAKHGEVTVAPQPGATVRLALRFGPQVRNVTLDGFAALGGGLINGAHHVTIAHSDFTTGLAVTGATSHIVLRHDTFRDLAQATWEGRLSIQGPGVTVTDSLFAGNARCSDGIFVGSATGTTIGPGNTFTGIRQGSCASHDDAIQLYSGPSTTIASNTFRDNDTIVMAPDGGDHDRITDNVMVGAGYVPAVQLGSQVGTSFTHNRTRGIDIHMDNKPGQPASRDGVITDNEITGGSIATTGCVSCTVEGNRVR